MKKPMAWMKNIDDMCFDTPEHKALLVNRLNALREWHSRCAKSNNVWGIETSKNTFRKLYWIRKEPYKGDLDS